MPYQHRLKSVSPVELNMLMAQTTEKYASKVDDEKRK